MKLWLKDRGQKRTYHFLRDSISHHGYAERAKLLRAGAFGFVSWMVIRELLGLWSPPDDDHCVK